MSEKMNNTDFFKNQYIEYYNNFISQLKIIFTGDETQQKL